MSSLGVSQYVRASGMVWAVPQHSRARVNEAGRAILLLPPKASEDDFLDKWFTYYDHMEVVNNWRASHSYPMNTFQATLRKRAGKIENSCIFATRIKRMESIRKKLDKREDMKLSQMQDIGGLRAIFSTTQRAYDLLDVYNSRQLDHIQAKCIDYIEQPKPEGYRSLHLIYKYRGVGRTPNYDDLKIEIQIRSSMQHAWATAVETVGIFTKQALKSSEGDERWLRFFALASSAIAEIEGTPDVPGVPKSAYDRNAELRALASNLNVRKVLLTYRGMLQALEKSSIKDAKFFLLSLVPEEGLVSAKGFLTRDSISATKQYNEMEERLAGKAGAQTVLVKVDSVSALRRAYPNYFADTSKFIEVLQDYLPAT